nr:S-norcoclaurine synthase 2-like [Ipomoea batatas]
MVFGAVSDEIEVKAPAAEAWKVYSTLQLAKLIVEMCPDLLEKFEEKFTVVDDEKRVKEVEVIEGGYLNLGFTLYRVRLEVIEKDERTCITKTTIEYEVKEESAANASFSYSQSLFHVQFHIPRCAEIETLNQSSNGEMRNLQRISHSHTDSSPTPERHILKPFQRIIRRFCRFPVQESLGHELVGFGPEFRVSHDFPKVNVELGAFWEVVTADLAIF